MTSNARDGIAADETLILKREILSATGDPESAGTHGFESGKTNISRRKMIATSAAAIVGSSFVGSRRASAAEQDVGDIRIRGVLSPVVTPFKADLSPDKERLIAHCKWLLSQNCGLAVFGTNSEANSLSIDERSALLDALLAAGIDTSRMMPGTGCCSFTETVKLTSQAVTHGCAGVLMLPPYYYKDVSEEGLYRYFSEVLQRVGDARLKIYLYHIPPVAVVGMTTGLVERLLKAYPNGIAGMKDSSGDWNNTKTFLDAFAKSGFDVFVGSEAFLLAGMRNGGAGTISATANVNPAAIHKLYAEWKNEDADDQQARLNVTRDVFSRTYLMIAALKQAIAIYADDPAWRKVRPPLVELTEEQAKRLTAELKAISFTMPGLKRG